MPTNFRALEQQGQANRKDEILRASISAYVALSRPNKRDNNQIEDLAMPILQYASEHTKRYICAALAENASAPVNLIRRLCAEPAEVCAPLLLLSPVMTAVDLVTLIGRHGNEHARIIARRNHLPNDVIEALALVDDVRVKARAAGTQDADATIASANVRPTTAEQARTVLAELALSLQNNKTAVPADETGHMSAPSTPDDAGKLIQLALREETGLFATALADATGLSLSKAQRIIRRVNSGELLTVLKALDVTVDAAFVITCALSPHVAANRQEIRLYRERFEQLDQHRAVDTVRRWKADEIAGVFLRGASNSDSEADQGAMKITTELKAL